MKICSFTIIIALTLIISNLSRAEVVIRPDRLYQEAIMAMENNRFKEAIKLMESSVNNGLKGDKLLDAYKKLYYVNTIIGDAKKSKYYETTCINRINSFKPILNNQTGIELYKVNTSYYEISKYNNIYPKNTKLLYQRVVNANTSAVTETPCLVDYNSGFDASAYITDAKYVFNNGFSVAFVEIILNRNGSRLLSEFTGDNVNKEFAIIVAGELITTMNILEKIDKGKLQFAPSYKSNVNDIYKLLAIISTIKRNTHKT